METLDDAFNEEIILDLLKQIYLFKSCHSR